MDGGKKLTRTVSRQLHCLAFPGCFLGRPGARKVDGSPNLSAVCSFQAAHPNGWHRATERRRRIELFRDKKPYPQE